MNSTYKKIIINSTLYILGILFVIILYEAFSIIKEKTAYNGAAISILVPHVSKIFKSFFKSLGQFKTYKAIFNTLWHLLISVIIGGALGIILGILGGISNKVRIFLKPIMTFMRSTPVIILTIILLLAVTNDSFVPLISTIIIIIPIFYEAVKNGVSGIENEQIDFYRLNSNLNFMVIKNVYIPATMGYIAQALVTSLSVGIKVIISTEYLSKSNNTIGYLIKESREQMNYDKLYACVFMVFIIVLIVELIPKCIKYLINMKQGKQQ